MITHFRHVHEHPWTETELDAVAHVLAEHGIVKREMPIIPKRTRGR